MKNNHEDTYWDYADILINKMREAFDAGDNELLSKSLVSLCMATAEYNSFEGNEFRESSDFGLICKNQEEADSIANLFDAMYGEKVCVTGNWSKEEDIESGIIDEYTGKAYVNIL